MNRGPLALALCLLVVLSGCSTILGPSAQPNDVQGVENGTLADSDALLDAHAESLTASGYSHVVQVNQSQTADGTTTSLSQEQRTSATAGASTYRTELVTSGSRESRFVRWGNETADFRRVERGGSQPQYSTGQPMNATVLTGIGLVRPYLAGSFEVAETTSEGGETRVVLESSGQPIGTVLPENVQSVSTYDARLVVDEQGRIHLFTVDAAYTVQNQSISFDVRYELTSDETPDVERPSWVDSAANGG